MTLNSEFSLTEKVEKNGVIVLLNLSKQNAQELSLETLVEHIRESEKIFSEQHELNKDSVQSLIDFYSSAFVRISESHLSGKEKTYLKGKAMSYIADLELNNYLRKKEIDYLKLCYSASVLAAEYLWDLEIMEAYLMELNAAKAAKTMFIDSNEKDIEWKKLEFRLRYNAAYLLVENAEKHAIPDSAGPYKSKQTLLEMAWSTLSFASDAAGVVYHATHENKWLDYWLKNKRKAAEGMESVNPMKAISIYNFLIGIIGEIEKEESERKLKKIHKSFTSALNILLCSIIYLRE